MRTKVGQTLVSTVDETMVVVVRAPEVDVVLTCGGAGMVDTKSERADAATSADPALQDGTLLGKRYADEAVGLELLCTKAGRGTLALNGAPLGMKQAKPLPSSD